MSLLFFVLAALCNSVMDTLRFHYESSPFRHRNPKFWNPNVSYKYARKILGWKFDAWHLFKSGMIVFILLAIVSYDVTLAWWFDFIVFGICWNIVFSTSYKWMYRP